jgi:hypothetical protein
MLLLYCPNVYLITRSRFRIEQEESTANMSGPIDAGNAPDVGGAQVAVWCGLGRE